MNSTIATDLAAGDYIVTVFDENVCTDTVTFTIISFASPTLLEATNISASCGQNDGSASVNAIGGTGDLTYSWSHDATLNSTTATDLTAGIYTVTVEDENNCEAILDINVSNADGPSLEVGTTTDETCEQSNGSINVAITNGIDVVFSWSHDATLDSNTADNLVAGEYTVTATDANGCEAIQTVTIENLDSPSIDEVLITDANCGAATGEASVLFTGGNGTIFTFSWSHDAALNSETATGLAAGDYSVSLSDENNCATVFDFIIAETAALTLDIVAVNDATCGEANGNITVSTLANNVTYEWSHDTTLDSNEVSNLAAGNYSVTATDENGCSVSIEVVITSPEGLEISATWSDYTGYGVSASGATDGSIDVTVSGGTGAYTYAW